MLVLGLAICDDDATCASPGSHLFCYSPMLCCGYQLLFICAMPCYAALCRPPFAIRMLLSLPRQPRLCCRATAMRLPACPPTVHMYLSASLHASLSFGPCLASLSCASAPCGWWHSELRVERQRYPNCCGLQSHVRSARARVHPCSWSARAC